MRKTFMVDCKKKWHRGCFEGMPMFRHEMVSLDRQWCWRNVSEKDDFSRLWKRGSRHWSCMGWTSREERMLRVCRVVNILWSTRKMGLEAHAVGKDISGSSGKKTEKLVFRRNRDQAYLCTVSSENCGWTLMCNHKTTGVSKLFWSLFPCKVKLNWMQNREKRNLRLEGTCVKTALWMPSFWCLSVKPLPWRQDRICSHVLKKQLIWGRIKHSFYFLKKTRKPSSFHLSFPASSSSLMCVKLKWRKELTYNMSSTNKKIWCAELTAQCYSDAKYLG